jgi:hypothetical protein
MNKTLSTKWRVLTASLRRLPDFIVIGVQKGGTSSLFTYLDHHPQLILPTVKEIHFFDLNYSKGIEWYKSHFPLKFFHAGCRTGEATPYYIFYPLAAKRVLDHCPNAKMIVLLRNPVDRAYSHYMMQFNRKIDPATSFEDAVALETERLTGELDKMQTDESYRSFNFQKYSYLSRGLYARQLKQWLRYFKHEQFLFLRSEDFFENPERELLQIYKFLGIKARLPSDLNPVNSNEYEPIKEETRAVLNAFFAHDKQDLAIMLGKKFLWQD